jgi:serine/threonine protein kinase
MIGSFLGPYEVLAKLGEGGMGEVYRARDTGLNRDVAIKILPESFAANTERVERFKREAQLLAALNHPNIAAIYGLEQQALVMELVEGEDLSVLIERGSPGSKDPGLHLSDAVAIARQIIDALEAAHEQGIIHRDLKPANIKVRADGTVKVLDFGLAKALTEGTEGSGGRGDSANSPTFTAQGTKIGMILGTAAYMAPEQARGRVVDRRADIWAFGVVLYEMLTGHRAFHGEDVSITLAAVLKEDVKWAALPMDLPAPIRRLLRRCLEKDPKRRLGAISDARFELDEATAPSSDVTSPSAARSGIGRMERVIWASVAALASVAAVMFAIGSTSGVETTPEITRFGVLPPADGQFSGTVPRFSISPNGRLLVFAASPELGKPDRLWLRRLDSIEVTSIPGTESAPGSLLPQQPFWSPDGRHLGFFVQDAGTKSRFRTVDLQAGSIQELCDLPSNNSSGSWNADDVILVSSQASNGIQRLPASGGVLVPVTTLDKDRKEIAHLWPQFLPDGRHFIYQSQTADRREWAIFVGALDSPDRRKLVSSEYARFAAPNQLLFVKDETLFAQTIDLGKQELTGEAVVVGTDVSSMMANGRAGFSVSDNGVLVYASSPANRFGVADSQLTWVDRQGKSIRSVGPPVSSFVVRLSPDGTRAAILEETGDRSQTDRSLWIADMTRPVKAPLTTRATLSPTWSHDSARLLFADRSDNGRFRVAERSASGATAASPFYEDADNSILPLDESADGKWVVLAIGPQGLRSLWVMPRSGGKPTVYLANGFDYPQASISHDGKWLAYTSNESGAYEVYVQSFPDPSRGKWPISTKGGGAPRWRRDGRELFFVDTEQRLIAVSINSDRDFRPGNSTPLFLVTLQPPGSSYGYDAAVDGQTFLIPLAAGKGLGDSRMPLTVTTNWMSLLKKK